MPSRLTEVDLARLRRTHGRLAGPPPAGPSWARWQCPGVWRMDRLVNGIGGVTLLNRLILAGSPLAGQRARIRLEPAPSAATPGHEDSSSEPRPSAAGNRRIQPTGTWPMATHRSYPCRQPPARIPADMIGKSSSGWTLSVATELTLWGPGVRPDPLSCSAR